MKTSTRTPSRSRFMGARLMPVAALALAGSLSHLPPALAASGPPNGGPTPDAQTALRRTDRLFFIENKGQWHQDVLYLARLGGLDAWITRYGVNYTFYKIERKESADRKEPQLPRGKFDHEDPENSTLLGHRVLFELQGHNPNPAREGLQKQEGYYNYLIGNDPSKHASYVGLYKEALVKDVYPGIDLRYYFDRGFLRYDFVVHPGADPAQIRFNLKGQDADEIKDNKLVYTTRFGEVQMAELRSYQSRGPVQSRLVKQGDGYGIALGRYDRNESLIIDPLVYSTYIGGSGIDVGSIIAVDGSGQAYVTGTTISTDYDVTAGAFQISSGGELDVFVTKLNASGTDLIYSTYIGGSDWDAGYDIAVDGSGQAYVTGYTQSSDYNVTAGAFQTSYGGVADVFVTKLDASGTGLTYSTYIGGSMSDVGLGIAVDNSGAAYVTGYTQSSDYDVTPGAFQTSYGGGFTDVFATKLNASGTGLTYSTYLGGSSNEEGFGIAVDGSGEAYVTGWTTSSDYDVTAGAYQTSLGGWVDVLVTKLNASGDALIYSTYLGGSDSEYGYGIAVDGSGNAYVTGYTGSFDYDVTPGAFQTTFSGGWYDVFVTKLNAAGSSMLYSTYIGGSGMDYGYGIAVDGSGAAYVTGYTGSFDYDVTPGAFQTTFSGGWYDVFVTKLNAAGSSLLYSTYIGGSSDEAGYGIAVDGSGNAYVTGYTESFDYDVTLGAFQTSLEGAWDVFVTKLCMDIPALSLTSAPGTDNQTLCYGYTAITPITYAAAGITSVSVSGLPPGISYTYSGDTVTISGTPTVYSGAYLYTVTGTGPCGTATATGSIAISGLCPTSLISPHCGITLGAMSQVLVIDSMPAVQYEVRIQDGVDTFYLLRPNTGFYFSMLPSMPYGATYLVDVRWTPDGMIWSGWGSACNVFTPSVQPLLRPDAPTCGLTMSSYPHLIKSETYPINYYWLPGPGGTGYEIYGATQYEFDFASTSPAHQVSAFRTPPSGRNLFLNLGVGLRWAYTYRLRIRSFVPGLGWSAWGDSCNITTPPIPLTQLQAGHCGATITSTAQVFQAVAMHGATQYEFRITDGVNTYTVLRPNRGCYLLLFGVPSWAAGTYTVDVRWQTSYGVWSPWGPPCSLVLPSPLTMEAGGVTEEWFDVQAFPVPFGDVVNLTVETTQSAPVRVTVMDMNGRVVEDRQAQMEHNGLLTLGESWANGVYMLRVQQGAEVRTLRVVKAQQ